MENLITNAKEFLNTEEGKKLAQSAGFGGSSDAFGNQGQEGQYGQQGQYGAVTGQGFGGGLAKGADGQQLQPGGQGESQDHQGNSGAPGQYGSEGQWGAVTGKGLGEGVNTQDGVDPRQRSNYEGWSGEDSTTSGGWGGEVFSRQAQMGGGDAERKEPMADDQDEGYKTGTSTPGYRHADDVDALAAENRVKNQNLNTNEYGQQSDDRGSKGNDYNEQI